MPDRDCLTFGDPDGFAAGFRDIRLDLVIAGPGSFSARVTRLNLGHLELCFCRERLPRIAFISLSPGKTFLSLPMDAASLAFNGFSLRYGDLVFHGREAHLHQRSGGACQWALLSLSHAELANCSRALTGKSIASPRSGRIVRPSHAEAFRLLGLLRHARRLAESKRPLIEHPEVAKALEQGMFHAMIHCLAGRDVDQRPETRRHRAAIMLRFEEALHTYAGWKPGMPALCAKAGVAERTLRMCCAEFLGMSPMRYLLLRRLNRARAMLMHAHASTTRVSDIARNNQFAEPGRFATMYRTTFGESPSVTLHRSP